MTKPISWIAIRGMNSDAILATLGLIETHSGDRRARMSISSLPNGWVVVFTVDFGFPTPARMKLLSANGEAVACSVEDRAMASIARGYRNGQAVWAVEHDSSRGIYDLTVAGKLPPEWAAVRERVTEEQNKHGGETSEVDYVFDAPMVLIYTLCGYRGDEERPKGQELKFTLLAPVGGAGLLGALGRLFGKR